MADAQRIPDHLPQPHNPARIPNIPDLRFENSYLRSISPYIQIRKQHDVHVDSLHTKEPEYEVVEPEKRVNPRRNAHPSQEVVVAVPSDEVIINWSKVLWITTRDQVLSPFIQGAVWGVAGHFLIPLVQRLRTRSARYLKTRLAVGEGQGVAWLRDWVRGLGTPSSGKRKYA